MSLLIERLRSFHCCSSEHSIRQAAGKKRTPPAMCCVLCVRNVCSVQRAPQGRRNKQCPPQFLSHPPQSRTSVQQVEMVHQNTHPCAACARNVCRSAGARSSRPLQQQSLHRCNNAHRCTCCLLVCASNVCPVLLLCSAFLKAPRLLLFDEATSALDTATERDILDALRSLAVVRTFCT